MHIELYFSVQLNKKVVQFWLFICFFHFCLDPDPIRNKQFRINRIRIHYTGTAGSKLFRFSNDYLPKWEPGSIAGRFQHGAGTDPLYFPGFVSDLFTDPEPSLLCSIVSSDWNIFVNSKFQHPNMILPFNVSVDQDTAY